MTLSPAYVGLVVVSETLEIFLNPDDWLISAHLCHLE